MSSLPGSALAVAILALEDISTNGSVEDGDLADEALAEIQALAKQVGDDADLADFVFQSLERQERMSRALREIARSSIENAQIAMKGIE